jgi:hypothetical protein
MEAALFVPDNIVNNIETRVADVNLASAGFSSHYVAASGLLDTNVWFKPFIFELENRKALDEVLTTSRIYGFNLGLDLHEQNSIYGLSINYSASNGDEQIINPRTFTVKSVGISGYYSWHHPMDFSKFSLLSDWIVSTTCNHIHNSRLVVANTNYLMQAKYKTYGTSLTGSFGIRWQTSPKMHLALALMINNTLIPKVQYQESGELGQTIRQDATFMNYVGLRFNSAYNFAQSSKSFKHYINFKAKFMVSTNNSGFNISSKYAFANESMASFRQHSNYNFSLNFGYLAEISDKFNFSLNYELARKTNTNLQGVSATYRYLW